MFELCYAVVAVVKYVVNSREVECVQKRQKKKRRGILIYVSQKACLDFSLWQKFSLNLLALVDRAKSLFSTPRLTGP